MPLTFAHPAVIIPFKYIPPKYYSWTGLIAGTLAPDFEAFIKLGGYKQFSHSWVGMLLFDLPVGVALTFLFHLVVRDALVQQLPSFLSNRLRAFSINWINTFRQRYGVIILSSLIGIFTHLVWDRLTHTDSYSYHKKAGIQIAPDVETTLRQWLQWSNSIIGLLIIIWQIYLLPVSKPKPLYCWKYYWIVVALTPIPLLAFRTQFYHEGDDLINTTIAGVLYGIILASLIFQKKSRQKNILTAP
ncbi:MAG TPA: DUF4184 family protein [Flavipsychrobacter sp.]|nr:DUF4184 family protein [Flavipsychrobacter sp.]